MTIVGKSAADNDQREDCSHGWSENPHHPLLEQAPPKRARRCETESLHGARKDLLGKLSRICGVISMVCSTSLADHQVLLDFHLLLARQRVEQQSIVVRRG